MSNIIIDNFKGGVLVAEHFNACGCKSALLVADNDICMDKSRMDGFLSRFSGIAQKLIVPMEKAARESFFYDNRKIFSECDCIFAVSDFYALEVMRFLQKNGFEIPGKIKIAGFDDAPVCLECTPNLTSVRQDTEKRARLALQKLTELKSADCGGEILLPVSLSSRGSSLPQSPLIKS